MPADVVKGVDFLVVTDDEDRFAGDFDEKIIARSRELGSMPDQHPEFVEYLLNVDLVDVSVSIERLRQGVTRSTLFDQVIENFWQ